MTPSIMLNSSQMVNKSASLNMKSRRDKLRTQGDMFEERSGERLSARDHSKGKADPASNIGSSQEPTLADVEAMLRFHGLSAGATNSDELLQASQNLEIDPQVHFNLNELKQLNEPNSANQLLDNSVSKPIDSIHSSSNQRMGKDGSGR